MSQKSWYWFLHIPFEKYHLHGEIEPWVQKYRARGEIRPGYAPADLHPTKTAQHTFPQRPPWNQLCQLYPVVLRVQSNPAEHDRVLKHCDLVQFPLVHRCLRCKVFSGKMPFLLHLYYHKSFQKACLLWNFNSGRRHYSIHFLPIRYLNFVLQINCSIMASISITNRKTRIFENTPDIPITLNNFENIKIHN